MRRLKSAPPHLFKRHTVCSLPLAATARDLEQAEAAVLTRFRAFAGPRAVQPRQFVTDAGVPRVVGDHDCVRRSPGTAGIFSVSIGTGP